MSERCFEIVLYKVRDADEARAARKQIMPFLARHPGFRSWRALVDLKDSAQFMDLIEWDTVQDAEVAAETIMRDPAFAAFMGQIELVQSMSHYRQAGSIAA